MSWFVEHLHRDGSVLARMAVPLAADGSNALFRIGRALDNDLILDDPHCAPHHARLEIAADGSARIVDLDTMNGIVDARGRRSASHEVANEQPFRLGHSQIRVRADIWPLPPEAPLSRRAVWPFALLGLALVLGNEAWDVWLRDVASRTPQYFYQLGAAAAGLCAWSGMYALLGRLISGAERFFSHVVIASTGFLGGLAILWLLETLAFAASWLWPLRIHHIVVVLVAAATVRMHLRLADPRHWPTLRIGVAAVALIAIAIPFAQQWISHQRLTDVDTQFALRHPALRVAGPQPAAAFSNIAVELKGLVDHLRKKDDDHLGQDGSMMDE